MARRAGDPSTIVAGQGEWAEMHEDINETTELPPLLRPDRVDSTG